MPFIIGSCMREVAGSRSHERGDVDRTSQEDLDDPLQT